MTKDEDIKCDPHYKLLNWGRPIVKLIYGVWQSYLLTVTSLVALRRRLIEYHLPACELYTQLTTCSTDSA